MPSRVVNKDVHDILACQTILSEPDLCVQGSGSETNQTGLLMFLAGLYPASSYSGAAG